MAKRKRTKENQRSGKHTVTNPTKINKTNFQLTPQTIEHKNEYEIFNQRIFQKFNLANCKFMRKLGATMVENTCMAASFYKEGMFGPIKLV
jgi:subtilase family serine protease